MLIVYGYYYIIIYMARLVLGFLVIQYVLLPSYIVDRKVYVHICLYTILRYSIYNLYTIYSNIL